MPDMVEIVQIGNTSHLIYRFNEAVIFCGAGSNRTQEIEGFLGLFDPKGFRAETP